MGLQLHYNTGVIKLNLRGMNVLRLVMVNMVVLTNLKIAFFSLQGNDFCYESRQSNSCRIGWNDRYLSYWNTTSTRKCIKNIPIQIPDYIGMFQLYQLNFSISTKNFVSDQYIIASLGHSVQFLLLFIFIFYFLSLKFLSLSYLNFEIPMHYSFNSFFTISL